MSKVHLTKNLHFGVNMSIYIELQITNKLKLAQRKITISLIFNIEN